MTYRVVGIDGDATRVVGDFPDYRAALRARVDDVMAQLEVLGWTWTRAEHVIIGPGVDGPRTVHPACTEVGVDGADSRIVTSAEVDGVRAWLLAAHHLDDSE